MERSNRNVLLFFFWILSSVYLRSADAYWTSLFPSADDGASGGEAEAAESEAKEFNAKKPGLLVSPIVNRELVASVVAPTWPTSSQNVFCEAFAFHKYDYESSVGSIFLDAVAKSELKLPKDNNGKNKLTYDEAIDIVVTASPLHEPSKRLLRYSLAMRSHSPQCELHRTMAKGTLEQRNKLSSFLDKNTFAVVFPGGQIVFEEAITMNEKSDIWNDLIRSSSTPVDNANKTESSYDFESMLLPGEVPICSNSNKMRNCRLNSLVILYANIGTAAFAKAYKSLIDSDTPFLVRNLGDVSYDQYSTSDVDDSPNHSSSPTFLQGYGVRLDIRNVEYKVFDDRKDTNNDQSSSAELNVTALDAKNLVPEQFLAGINISKILYDHQRNSEEQPNYDPASSNDETEKEKTIKSILEILWEQHNEQHKHAQIIPPTWQRRQLPLQATVAIIQSAVNRGDALLTLQEISQNLPSVASTLVHTKIPSEVSEIAEAFDEQLRLPSKGGTLLVNGRIISMNRASFNVFELFNTIKQEQIVLENLQATFKKQEYWSFSLLQKLQKAYMMGDEFVAWSKGRDEYKDKKKDETVSAVQDENDLPIRIDVGRKWKQAIIYVNDVEKDAKYAHWQRSVQQALMKMQYGMPPSVRRNLFTILAVVDPLASVSQDHVIQLGSQLIESSFPARLGILMVNAEDVRLCGNWIRNDPVNNTGPCPTQPIFQNHEKGMESPSESLLKTMKGTTQAVHKLFAHVSSAYAKQSGASQAYIEYFSTTVKERFDEMDGSVNEITMFDLLEIHTELIVGFNLMRNDQAWKAGFDVLLQNDETHDDGKIATYGKALRFASEKALKPGMGFINGRPLPSSDSGEDLHEGIGTVFREEQQHIFGLIHTGRIKDNSPRSVYAHLLSGPRVYKRVHPLLMIDSSSNGALADSYVDLSAHGFGPESILFSKLPEQNLRSVDAVLDIEAVLEIDTREGIVRAMRLLSVMEHFSLKVGDGAAAAKVLVGYRIIPSSASGAATPLCPLLAHAGDIGFSFVNSILKTVLSSEKDALLDELLHSIPGLSNELRERILNSADADTGGICCYKGSCETLIFPWIENYESAEKDVTPTDDSKNDVGRSGEKKNFLTCNGRILELEELGGSFEKDDIELLIALEMDQAKAVTELLKPDLINHEFRISCDAIGRAAAFLSTTKAQSSQKITRMALEQDIAYIEQSLDTVKNSNKNPLRFSWNMDEDSFEDKELKVDIHAIVDPATEFAQRLSPLLLAFRDYLKLPITLMLVPRIFIDGESKVPITSYYRFVADPLALPDTIEYPKAHFANLPVNHVLTLRMDVPEPWDIQQSRVIQDTDNLRCDVRTGCSDDDATKGESDESNEKMSVHEKLHTTSVEYSLNHLLFFGQCYDASGSSPNGLQLTLSKKSEMVPDLTTKASATAQTEVVVGVDQFPSTDLDTKVEEDSNKSQTNLYSETLVMKNVGYWQLRANPGVWNLQIAKDSKGAEIFDIVEGKVRGGKIKYNGINYPNNATKSLVMTDFVNRGELLVVKRRPGMSKANLFADTAVEKSMVGESEAEVINVFSLATGHLYERFLKIMMLSVTKRTSTRVKFWLFENYLSPSFKASARYMAEQIGCEVEFVTYKWPEWLRGQSEKQRIIWGYKILFLDVLFPLDVKKIIYVDADQVVRGDLKELWDLDLQGAPYGYTPFCTSRETTLGFQFWRGGFWESHLRGKPYHISALYVVDLEKFRKDLVGDQLRSTYQQLSADPHSLSNLDQDLPNYAQHQVPIFSLPQEWLWCETWCSDETKATAKTIDLCNNPLHKEPKVSMAKRIISGEYFDESWVELDAEVEVYEQKYISKQLS